MKFVFFGTDDFSVTVLDELKRAGFVPSLVVTVPDRPKGRGLALTPSPTKVWSLENNIEILQPESLKIENCKLKIKPDLGVVASYGKIIPKWLLNVPKYGMLNVHPSLLPKYRGPSPIESQILNDEKEIGVTIMKMDEKMDHGPTLASWKLDAGNWKDNWPPKASELRKKLAEEGGKLLAETIPKWIAGEITAVPQDESSATYTKKIIKKDGEIHLADDAYKNFLKIRAFDGTIGTYFYMKKSTPSPSFTKGGARGGFSERYTRVIIKDAKLENGKLIIVRVIPEGRKEMDYK